MFYTFFSECIIKVADVFIIYYCILQQNTIKLFFDFYECVSQINIANSQDFN